VLATDANFANVVLRDTFSTLPFTVTGLQPLTKYYLKANVICSDLDESPYSRVLDFSTPTAVCYDNNFDEEPTHYPSNWNHSFSPSLDYLARKYSYISNPSVPSSGNSYGWKLKPALFANGKFSSAKHFVATPSKSSSKSTLWAISPVIAMDENANQHLSFDLALTERETNNPVDFSIMQGDTMMAFGVLIAEDVAYTYNRENLTLWKTSGSVMEPEYDFTEIPHRGKEYSIDLSKYKDDISIICDYYNVNPSLVEGDYNNIKVTTIEDLKYINK
jgi:hypothetical protein